MSRWPRHLLVLDSTELTRDWRLRGNAHRLLHHLDQWQVVVPEVVLDEVKANFSRHLDRQRKHLAGLQRELDALGVQLQEVEISDTAEVEYEAHLKDVLERLGAVVAPYPQAGHAVVARRAMARVPPFNEQGGGYRDTVVWLTLLEFADSGDTVVLASADKAFRSASSDLRPALAAEGLAADVTVTLIRDLSAWAKDQIPWSQPANVREALDAVREDQLFSYLTQWGFEDVHVSGEECGLPFDEASPVLDLQYDGLERIRVVADKDGSTLVSYRSNAEAEIEFEFDEATALLNGWVTDASNRRNVVTVTLSVQLVLHMDVVYDEHMDEFGQFDIVSLRFEPRSPKSSQSAPVEVEGQLELSAFSPGP